VVPLTRCCTRLLKGRNHIAVACAGFIASFGYNIAAFWKRSVNSVIAVALLRD
jgi:hypothetical protein